MIAISLVQIDAKYNNNSDIKTILLLRSAAVEKQSYYSNILS
jgi:hypothetical protein